jgi:hypothetical protein
MFTEKDFDEFESAMAAKARAEARHLSSQATLRRGGCVCLVLLGVGGLIALTGEGVSLATGGMYAAQESEKTVAAILAQNREQNREDLRAMLADTTIQTHVTVGGEVSVRDGGTVRVVEQAPDGPRLQPEQVQQDEQPAPATGTTVTNFTMFHQVAFGAGQVETEATVEDRRLSGQYCYYIQPAHAPIRTFTTIGHNGRIELPATAPAGVDLRAAYQLCDWKADSTQPAPVAPVAPVQTIQIHAPKR